MERVLRLARDEHHSRFPAVFPFFLVVFIGFAALWPRPLMAQTDPVHEQVLSPEDVALASINTEADWATALYVTSVSSTVIGFVTGLTLWGTVLFVDTPPPVEAHATAITFLTVGTLGLTTFLPLAIALDVDSGSRRAGLARARDSALTFGLSRFELQVAF